MSDLRDAITDALGLLLSLGDGPSEAGLRALGLGHAASATVPLLVGDLTVVETLDYARVLLESGRPTEARELVWAALRVAAVAVVQGPQRPWVTWAQGPQVAEA